MKERPILFSAPMVQAILAGNKTQTRRVIKGFEIRGLSSIGSYDWFKNGKWEGAHKPTMNFSDSTAADNCPYGQVGDQLWVREAWGYHDPDGTGEDFESPDCGTSSEYMLHQENETLLNFWLRRIAYRATFKYPRHGIGPDAPKKWRPSIHMPRWASRIQLEITNIRVERLQDISEADALSEGCMPIPGCKWRTWAEEDAGIPMHDHTAKDAFSELWEAINGEESWNANPWVWVVEFKRIKP